MKKAIILFILFAFCKFSLGQLNIQTIQEAHHYEIIYKWWMGWGQIRYTGSQYILVGASSNKYEDTMHSIVLGSNKEETIQSLKDLNELKGKRINEPLIVYGINRKHTQIYNELGSLTFSTDGVSGESYAISYLNIDKAIHAIQNY